MKVQCTCQTLVLFLLFTAILGCGKSDSTTAEADSEDQMLADILKDIDLTEGRDESEFPEPPSAADSTACLLSDSADSSLSIAPIARNNNPTAQSTLQLELNPGDRFSLVKTVEQMLVQQDDRFPASAQSKLDLHMTIGVDQVAANAILMNVVYSRVAYFQDVNGVISSFDSSQSAISPPVEFAPYAGMVGNGFSFWLGKDNKVRELVGFGEFLDRCTMLAPQHHRAELLGQLSSRFAASGVAGFVDDSIGLLPYDSLAEPGESTQVAVGDEWIHEVGFTDPAAMNIRSVCRLVSMTDTTAEIEIAGQVNSANHSGSNSNVVVTGGRSTGSCTVDRSTGLPTDVQRSQYLNLLVTANDGQTFRQDKHIRTTIRTANARQRPVVHQQGGGSTQQHALVQHGSAGDSGRSAASIPRQIQQTSGTMLALPVQAPSSTLSSTATAVYPD